MRMNIYIKLFLAEENQDERMTKTTNGTNNSKSMIPFKIFNRKYSLKFLIEGCVNCK